MRLLIDLDGTRTPIELRAWTAQTTVAQLIERASGMTPIRGERFYLDDEEVPADAKLNELTLLEGSRISRTASSPAQPIGGWNVAVSAGIDSGCVIGIPDHREMRLGRAPGADLPLPTESASWNHCTLQLEEGGVRIRDSGSTNGTLVDGLPADSEEGTLVIAPATVTAGGAILSLRPSLIEPAAPAPGSLGNLTPASTAPFNRPPRLGQAEVGAVIQPPGAKEISPAAKFNFIAVLLPLVLAGALVLVLGNLSYALFALLSPLLAIGMHFEQRRRRAKDLRDEAERFGAALADFRADLESSARAETQRLEQMAPDPSVVLRRPALPSTSLWHRRIGQAGFLALRVGTGDVPWKPELDLRGVSRLDERAQEIFDVARLSAAPVIADLSDAGVIGLTGDREGCLALARSLLIQAAVHCGPADLTIGVFCDAGREDDWEWTAWLPQTRQAGASPGARWISNQHGQSTSLIRSLLENRDSLPTPSMLMLIDSEVLTEGRDAPARDLLGRASPAGGEALGPGATKERMLAVSGIVIAGTADQLPASCTTVVEVGADASCAVQHANGAGRLESVILAGVTIERVTSCARTLAHFEDPEFVVPGAALPALVRLPELLGVAEMNADAVGRLWASSTGISALIGLGEAGSLSLDLGRDGPHGLVGGTTGSGKSEFLRSFVAGLAARNDPTKLNFILIDFKGGAAFKACERLPHTIGTISNLDEQLADRAVRAPEAKMEPRQRLFAGAGEDVKNLPAYLATDPAEPLPRLLLVIDEFAMLAKEFPEVLASLVSVGAVGRTLGVHMILATQRPAGVVNDDILANTNLRVALRVQSRDDSTNVIGVPSAASIGRSQMGRAYVKLGQDDITPVQTALVTGRAPEASIEQLEIVELGLFGVPLPQMPKAHAQSGDANDLDLLIDAVVAANAAAGFAPPREVWPEALGERVTLAGYAEETSRSEDDLCTAPAVGGMADGVLRVALADEPAMQRQLPVGWAYEESNLLLIGVPGSGTSTTLASIALALADSHSPEELDILCLDMGSRALSPLADLPHTTAYVGAGAGAKEQSVRFIRHLRAEFQRRRQSSARGRRTVVLVDGFVALRDEFHDLEGQGLLDAFYRVYADGPSVGIHFAISTTRAKAVPAALDEVTLQRWVYRLADAHDYSFFGIRGSMVPAPVPGRCIDTVSMLQMHIATPDCGIEAAVQEATARWSHLPTKPDAVGTLPSTVSVAELESHFELASEPLRFPVGIREDTLGPVLLEIYQDEHVLIAGPPRSGKSTLLLAIAELLRHAPDSQRPRLWGICDRRSPLRAAALDRIADCSEEVPPLLAALQQETAPTFLLIDDAERVADTDQRLTNLFAAPPAHLTVIAAGRASELRSSYSHWTKEVSKARCGVLLQPDVSADGELLGVKLPRIAPVALTPGRGYVCVGGEAWLAQTIDPKGDTA